MPLLALTISACTAYKTNYAVNSVSAGAPVVDRVLTAHVGDTVVRQGGFATTRAIRVRDDVTVGVFGGVQIRAGNFVMVGEDAKSEFFRPEAGLNGGRITKSVISDPMKGVQAYKASARLCSVSIFNSHDCRDNVAFTRVERLVADPGSTRQHLVYGGRRGDILTFSAVEPAAPRASTGLVTHDLSRSSRVSHLGMIFDVVSATADAITYRVVGTTPLTS